MFSCPKGSLGELKWPVGQQDASLQGACHSWRLAMGAAQKETLFPVVLGARSYLATLSPLCIPSRVSDSHRSFHFFLTPFLHLPFSLLLSFHSSFSASFFPLSPFPSHSLCSCPPRHCFNPLPFAMFLHLSASLQLMALPADQWLVLLQGAA